MRRARGYRIADISGSVGVPRTGTVSARASLALALTRARATHELASHRLELTCAYAHTCRQRLCTLCTIVSGGLGDGRLDYIVFESRLHYDVLYNIATVTLKSCVIVLSAQLPRGKVEPVRRPLVYSHRMKSRES